MKIAICTKGRPDRQYTLKQIYKIFPKDIYLFVEPQDWEKYQKYSKVATIVNIGENDKGIAYSRQYANDYLGDEIIFFLDDDITAFKKRAGAMRPKQYFGLTKMTPAEIKGMFKYIEKFLLNHPDYLQATISYGKSNWLYNGVSKENTRAWCFEAHNNKTYRQAGIEYDPKLNIFEDYNITLEILNKGYKNISFYYWAFDCKTMSKETGGCGTAEQRRGKHEAAAEIMTRKWGNEIAQKIYNKNHDLTEVKINWKKVVEYGR